MKQVVIVVPLYNSRISDLERVSLNQLIMILGTYDICFISPIKLKRDLGNSYSGRRIEFFDNVWFENRMQYSRLCLNDILYKRFSNYKYMLIHQLDAFVFYNGLDYFCSLGYDYIGAPHSQMSATIIRNQLRADKGFFVGNGGFSLRNIDSCIRALSYKKEIYGKLGEGYFDAAEDSYFTYCGMVQKIPFVIPKVEEAVRFSIQGDVDYIQLENLLGNEIPFGTHAWARDYCFPYVYSFIKCALGDKLDTLNIVNDSSIPMKIRLQAIRTYLRYHVFEFHDIDRIREVVQSVLDEREDYVLWGYGEIGVFVEKLLCKTGITIAAVFDKNSDRKVTRHGISVYYPTPQMVNKSTIIISSSIYRDEIANEIDGWDDKTTKYITWDDIEQDILCALYGDNLENAYYQTIEKDEQNRRCLEGMV